MKGEGSAFSIEDFRFSIGRNEFTYVKFPVVLTTMYSRLLKTPSESVLLFGPRGVGKSTWIRERFPDAVVYDLLNSREALRLERDPHLLFDELKTLPVGHWVVLDEVQRVPELLNEVHRLMENYGLRFVLCGSSARKLKRSGANLLAGRAKMVHFFPLVSAEMGADFDLRLAITQGTLPLSVTGTDFLGFLTTYAEVYLNEEIRAEALTRNVGAFSRFLEIAARQNGQVTNLSNISREAGVSRSTVQNYFDILVDTLIGYWVVPWKLKKATKQVVHPKFYLFDTGVARALSGRAPYPPTQEETEPLLETLIFNEVRAFIAYNQLRYPLHFWRNHEGAEVDLLCETRKGFVAIEIKATAAWQKRYSRGLHRFRSEVNPEPCRMYGVCQGEHRALVDDVLVLPVSEFLTLLWRGEVI